MGRPRRPRLRGHRAAGKGERHGDAAGVVDARGDAVTGRSPCAQFSPEVMLHPGSTPGFIRSRKNFQSIVAPAIPLPCCRT
ncbi:MAG: hypothetical protein ACK55I_06560, partial [bacterium]